MAFANITIHDLGGDAEMLRCPRALNNCRSTEEVVRLILGIAVGGERSSQYLASVARLRFETANGVGL